MNGGICKKERLLSLSGWKRGMDGSLVALKVTSIGFGAHMPQGEDRSSWQGKAHMYKLWAGKNLAF